MSKRLETQRVPFSFEEARKELDLSIEEFLDTIKWAGIEALFEIPRQMVPRLYYDGLNMTFDPCSHLGYGAKAAYVIIDYEELETFATAGAKPFWSFNSISLTNKTAISKESLHTTIANNLLKAYRASRPRNIDSKNKIIELYRYFKERPPQLWFNLESRPMERPVKISLPYRILPLEAGEFAIQTAPLPYSLYNEFLFHEHRSQTPDRSETLKISKSDVQFYSSEIYELLKILKGISQHRKIPAAKTRLQILNETARIFEHQISKISESGRNWHEHQYGQGIFEHLKFHLSLADETINCCIEVLVDHESLFSKAIPLIRAPKIDRPSHISEALARINQAMIIGSQPPYSRLQRSKAQWHAILKKCGIKAGKANILTPLLA